MKKQVAASGAKNGAMVDVIIAKFNMSPGWITSVSGAMANVFVFILYCICLD